VAPVDFVTVVFHVQEPCDVVDAVVDDLVLFGGPPVAFVAGIVETAVVVVVVVVVVVNWPIKKVY
jgi:hypothetical protein